MKKIIFVLIAMVIMSTAVFAEPNLEISSVTTPDLVSPGNNGIVEISVRNIGTSVTESLVISLAKLDSPIQSLTPTYIETVGSLNSGEAAKIIFKFSVPPGTNSGFYTAHFNIRCCDASICKNYIQYSLIKVQSPTSLQLYSLDPEYINIGEETEVLFNLKNIGKDDLSSVYLSWTAANPGILPSGSDNEIYIPTIKAGIVYGVPVKFFVKQSVASDVYPLNLSLRYNDASGTTRETISTVGIKITGDVNFIITPKTDSFYYGKSNALNIDITNTGTSGAQFLTASINSKYGNQDVYVGEIDSDDYETVSFTQNIGMTRSPYTANITLAYRDKFNKQYTFVKEVTISPTNAPIGIMDIITVLILGGIGYWYYKKKFKK